MPSTAFKFSNRLSGRFSGPFFGEFRRLQRTLHQSTLERVRLSCELRGVWEQLQTLCGERARLQSASTLARARSAETAAAAASGRCATTAVLHHFLRFSSTCEQVCAQAMRLDSAAQSAHNAELVREVRLLKHLASERSTALALQTAARRLHSRVQAASDLMDAAEQESLRASSASRRA